MYSSAGGYTRLLLSYVGDMPQAEKTEDPSAASLPSGLLMSKMNVAVLKYYCYRIIIFCCKVCYL